MKIFENDFTSVPILVCLTCADRLYEEKCDDDMIPTCPDHKLPMLKMQFEDELQVRCSRHDSNHFHYYLDNNR